MVTIAPPRRVGARGYGARECGGRGVNRVVAGVEAGERCFRPSDRAADCRYVHGADGSVGLEAGVASCGHDARVAEAGRGQLKEPEFPVRVPPHQRIRAAIAQRAGIHAAILAAAKSRGHELRPVAHERPRAVVRRERKRVVHGVFEEVGEHARRVVFIHRAKVAVLPILHALDERARCGVVLHATVAVITHPKRTVGLKCNASVALKHEAVIAHRRRNRVAARLPERPSRRAIGYGERFQLLAQPAIHDDERCIIRRNAERHWRVEGRREHLELSHRAVRCDGVLRDFGHRAVLSRKPKIITSIHRECAG